MSRPHELDRAGSERLSDSERLSERLSFDRVLAEALNIPAYPDKFRPTEPVD